MRIHRVTVTFTDVWGVNTSRTNYGTVTGFNFAAHGRREYAVQIGGSVHVEKGLTVTAALRDPDNWQTLEGWLNHQNGCIEGVPPIRSLGFAAGLFGALFFVVLILSFKAWAGGSGAHALGIGMSIAFGLAALYAVDSWYRKMKVWNELEAARAKKNSLP
jgi:hypothetical protein